jgi:hypothetical protein
MGKWVKQAGIPVNIEKRPRVIICEYGVEHRGDTCRCAHNEPDVPDNAKPGGFTVMRKTRTLKRRPRVEDGRASYAFSMDRREARKQGLNPHVKSRRKPPSISAPMWEMDNEQRRRAASRARSM